MPSFPYTPAALVLTGGEFQPEPIRFSYTAGRLTLTAGSFVVGPSLSTTLAGLALILDNLFADERIVDAQGRPTARFQEIWRNFVRGLKDVLTLQGGEIGELQAIYAAINVAQSTGATAVQLQQAAASEQALAQSYTNPVGVGAAASSGTVTISAHERIYGDGTTVSVNAGSVTGLTPETYVTIYYVDAARAGGAVTYQGTTGAVSQTGSTHIVWQGAIPAIGQPDAPGSGPTAPGYTPPPSDGQYDTRLIEYEQGT